MFLELTNVNKTYKTGDVSFKALANINFSLEKGNIGVILGPSGSGKSTLLNVIGGIDITDNGAIFVDGKDITELNDRELTNYRREEVGFIFQFYNLIPNLTVYENVEVAANISKNPMKVEEVLDAVGLLDLKDRFPKELSGGQQQRVSIARAIIKKPKLLLCDEPTGALDYNNAIEILKLLTDINKKYNTTILIITHNTAISGIANRIVRLRSGEIIENKYNDNILPAERVEW
ncbi:ABC transporter ATP-binding protein [Vulcanibacillus modesticaldus]|uniref:ABC transporter ATP-binding protein n=1 Tax=Vulcanibacillus modesticaldus TaxID=337097 RepID=A0A1D2YWD8_9BACI|nr:ABC transporter ATP-binding protein [Vulcanibacillus modesticaldus]OEF99966.1 ABC transporter ATP-binding protein [Vulcanibacillus modesticaldus]